MQRLHADRCIRHIGVGDNGNGGKRRVVEQSVVRVWRGRRQRSSGRGDRGTRKGAKRGTRGIARRAFELPLGGVEPPARAQDAAPIIGELSDLAVWKIMQKGKGKEKKK